MINRERHLLLIISYLETRIKGILPRNTKVTTVGRDAQIDEASTYKMNNSRARIMMAFGTHTHKRTTDAYKRQHSTLAHERGQRESDKK